MAEIKMNDNSARKYLDLEERTFNFAKQVNNLSQEIIPKTIENNEYLKQLIRSSGSVAANYIEANESFGGKDFQYRIKICRKEAKESRLWLKLINVATNKVHVLERQKKLIQEALELIKIFTAILKKSR